MLSLILSALIEASDPLCREVRDVMLEFGATQEEVITLVGKCEGINNPELKEQDNA